MLLHIVVLFSIVLQVLEHYWVISGDHLVSDFLHFGFRLTFFVTVSLGVYGRCRRLFRWHWSDFHRFCSNPIVYSSRAFTGRVAITGSEAFTRC